MKEIRSFRDLIVWNKSMDLVDKIYEITAKFPKEEQFGLISQMRRCSVSIPSNIAEGHSRGTRNDYARFISMALGSSGELQTQLIVSWKRGFTSQQDYQMVDTQLTAIMKMLRTLRKKLKPIT